MAIPKRWLPYSALGDIIEGTRFISFKVPLNHNISSKVPKAERFTPANLIEKIEESGHRLGLVIDLTNTSRYYNKQDIEKHGIQYAKIFTEGHKIPKSEIVQQFFEAVENLVQEDEKNDLLIGVHCTHGVNRTGYLVCRYMVDKMSIDPEKAIQAFSKGRGHPIEREFYIQDLLLRKDGGPGLEETEEESNVTNGQHEEDKIWNINYLNIPPGGPGWNRSNWPDQCHSWEGQNTNWSRNSRGRNSYTYSQDNGGYFDARYNGYSKPPRHRWSGDQYQGYRDRSPHREDRFNNDEKYDEDYRPYGYVSFSQDY